MNQATATNFTPAIASPGQTEINARFRQSLTIANYVRDRQVINPQGKLILDLGCGNGMSTLMLAQANPGAKIIAIDHSAAALEIAQQRLQAEGIGAVEFQAIAPVDLPQLGLQFDFINFSDSQYLHHEPAATLQAIATVLAAQGIIHASLQSFYQRANFLRGNELAAFIGLIDEESPGLAEAEIMRDLLLSMYPTIALRETTLTNRQLASPELVRSNFLVPGDRGFTIPDLFASLETAGLEFIQLTNWQQWQLRDLFKPDQNMPEHLRLKMSDASAAELLHMYELLNPVHRWLDFWCGHPGFKYQPEKAQVNMSKPIADWDQQTWQTATVHLNPQLRTQNLATHLQGAIANLIPLPISAYFNLTSDLNSSQPLQLFPYDTIMLSMLWQQPRQVQELINLWQQVKPVDFLTFQPLDETAIFEQVKRSLIHLEKYLLVLIERST
jgi:SAM-dependent methyltransferase